MKMPVAGMMTPTRTETYQNLQLNAGIFLYNFNYDEYATIDALRAAVLAKIQANKNILGSTRGGGSFVVTQEVREPEVDGARYRFKGGSFVDSVDANMTGTLLEVTPENFKYILATGDITYNGAKTTVKMHTRINTTDHLDNLVWIGDLADGSLIMIVLKNALNTNGMNLTFTDKGEGTIPFEFHAYQASVEDYDTAPFEVVFLDGGETSDSVSIVPAYNTVEVGDTVTLYKRPSTAAVTWASDDTDIATVTSGGIVTGVAAGTVTITATLTADNTVQGIATVRVVSASEG